MSTLYATVYWLHVPIAISCIPAFWIATLTKKGGRAHVRSGRWFAYAMLFVSVSGMLMAALTLADPFVRHPAPGGPNSAEWQALAVQRGESALFLLYLGVITGWPTLHGLRVVRSRRDPRALASPAYRALAAAPAAASVFVIAVAFQAEHVAALLFGMSPIGLLLSGAALSYLRAPDRAPWAWRVEHLLSMGAAGIAAHTAFGVFFVTSLLGVRLPGLLQLLPWLAPTIVGVPALIVAVRREERRLSRSTPRP